MKADELWDKYAAHRGNGYPTMDKPDFLAALAEYGEHVKSEAVKVRSSEFPSNWCDPLLTGNDKVLKMGRQAVLLVPVSLAGVGNFAIVTRKKKPTPMAVRVFVNVVSHGGLL